jgi:hypothetical protein
MKRRLKKMKKTISGVLLALTAVFALVACGKKTTKKDETTKKGEATTTKKTTKLTSKEKIEKKNKIVFHCWNNEFQSRVNDYYKNVNYYDANTTYLLGGNYIEWVTNPNEGSNYQDKLDIALGKDEVDMFVFEADYATKYVKNEKVADLKTAISLDTSKQYKYTVDVVTNGEAIMGSSWQATPGVTIYNNNVAKAVFGDDVTYDTMVTKLNAENFKATAAAVKAAKKNKFMMIGPDCWFRVYSNNLTAKMWDGTNLTVDKQLFQWAKDTKEFYDARYIRSVDDDYGLWGAEWGAEQGKDNCLCIFSCPWFTDFCLTGYRANKGEEDKPIAQRTDCGLRVAPSHKGWFWGGTWLTATKTGLAKDGIKDDIATLIKTMTTDKETLVAIAKGANDFTNSTEAMADLAKDDSCKVAYFGGQNCFSIYAKSVEGADLSKASDYDQQVAENIQAAFRKYFQAYSTAKEAWDEFVKALQDKITKTPQLPEGVTVTDAGITIA